MSHLGDIAGLPAGRAVVALAHAELDQLDEARETLEPLAASGFSRFPVDVMWLRAVTDSAAACARVGDRSWAETLRQLLAPYSDLFPTACLGTATGSVAHYRGLLAVTLGRYDEAEARFAAAHASHRRIGAPTWLARTRLEWARMLLARRHPGDIERARELLGQALIAAREFGLAQIEQRAVASLEACG